MSYIRPPRSRAPAAMANLPYVAVIVVTLAVLTSYLLLGDPFGSGGDATAPSSTSAATTTSTTVSDGGTSSTEATTTTVAATTTVPAVTTSTGPAASRGESLFRRACQVCHGPGGAGIDGLGKPLTTSIFAAGLSDDELLAFLMVGRAADDPLNTIGIAMPPRGGVASFSDADLREIVAYVRSIGP